MEEEKNMIEDKMKKYPCLHTANQYFGQTQNKEQDSIISFCDQKNFINIEENLA